MVTMPVPKGFKVTSSFGPRWGATHWGTDYGCGDNGNKPVYAVKEGTVTRAGSASGFGQWVTVDHPASNGGGETVYGHVIPEVRVGQKVREGERIARINPDSRTNGGVVPHLHFEWHRFSWVPPGPNRLNPEVMLKGAGWVGDAPAAKPATVQPTGNSLVPVLDWTRRFVFGKARPTHQIKNIIIHVTVNAAGTPAENVAQYQIDSQSGSYHELTDTTVKHLVENTDDWFTWSSGNYGNDIGLHRSFVLWGTETRVQWLQYDKMLREAAKRDAEWCRKYNIPPVKLTAADLRAGKKGFAGHLETGQAWGGTDHVDPGTGFPWDVYLGYVRDYLNGSKTDKEGDVLTTKYFTDFLKGFIGPIISDVKDIRQQFTGGRDAGEYPGWSISQLVKNYQSKPGDSGTVPEMLAVALTEIRALREDVNKLKEGR